MFHTLEGFSESEISDLASVVLGQFGSGLGPESLEGLIPLPDHVHFGGRLQADRSVFVDFGLVQAAQCQVNLSLLT